MAKKIFLSYASQDKGWIDTFTSPDYFRNIIGDDVTIEKYDDAANFGPMKAWMNERIENAAAVILFVSENYICKEATLFEFFTSLEEHTLRQLVFVPVMMDGPAIGWWKRQKASGSLKELTSDEGGDYAFAKFVGPNGEPEAIFENGHFNYTPSQRIITLAEMIKMELDPRDIPPPPPPPPSSEPIVLLGHPTADMPKGVAEPRDRLLAELAGLPLQQWEDRWNAERRQNYRDKAVRVLDCNPVFVQPVGPGEANELAVHPEIQRYRLKSVAGADSPAARKVDGCRLVLWLPEGLQDPDLKETNLALPTIFSRQSPYGLAQSLKQELGPVRPLVPVILLEELSENLQLRSQLESEFRKVVEQAVIPAPDFPWEFANDSESDMLEQQIRHCPGDKVILAINDLDVGPAKDTPAAREKLEQKLTGYMDRLKKAQEKTGRQLNVFCSTIVSRNAELLPFVRYPSPELANWYLFTFFSRSPLDLAPLPKKSPSRLFRRYLQEWAQA